ncbi:MAG TPA: hypothetical protein VFN74_03280, partial [Chloroflexota bacterium]|nr:hypothetical protein [Chloroflexota bacterium]
MRRTVLRFGAATAGLGLAACSAGSLPSIRGSAADPPAARSRPARPGPAPVQTLSASSATGDLLLVTNSTARHVSFVDPAAGVLSQVEVGTAPWGAALAPDGRAYVATAEGVAVVDTRRRELLALIPYRAPVGPPRFGEYRNGGMGIAVSPEGDLVYVGLYLGSAPSRLEVIDVARLEVVGDAPLGIRPFDVLAAAPVTGRR